MGKLITLPGGNMIKRHVFVDRYRPPMEILQITGRLIIGDPDVVASMPRGEGSEVDVFFFKTGRFLEDDELEHEYLLRRFVPADPYSLIVVNAVDPAFADQNPNGTHWRGADNDWYYAAFSRLDVRGVSVNRSDGGWGGGWWHAGLR